MSATSPPPPKTSPRLGGSISSPASKPSAPTGACSRAISRRTSSRAATPSCGTRSSASLRARRRPKRRHSTAGLRRGFTALRFPDPVRPGRALAMSLFRSAIAAVVFGVGAPALADPENTAWPNYREGDFTIADYKFASGETLPQLKLHYRTLGTAQLNAAGEIVNGVLLL